MPICPTCHFNISAREQSLGYCPHCGRDFRAPVPALIANVDAEAVDAQPRNLLDERASGDESLTRTITSDIPPLVDFGPASPPWPQETAGAPTIQPPPGDKHTAGPLQTITSIP